MMRISNGITCDMVAGAEPQMRRCRRQLVLCVMAACLVALGATTGAYISGWAGAIAGLVAACVLFSVLYRVVVCLDAEGGKSVDQIGAAAKVDQSPLKAGAED